MPRGTELDATLAQHIIHFLKTKVLRDPNKQIDVDTPLVSSGMMDSFALVDALLELEKVTKRRIPAMKVQPKDMDTVSKMFETAERVGKPRGREMPRPVYTHISQSVPLQTPKPFSTAPGFFSLRPDLTSFRKPHQGACRSVKKRTFSLRCTTPPKRAALKRLLSRNLRKLFDTTCRTIN